MYDIEEDIDVACATLHLSEQQWRKCDRGEAEAVIHEVRQCLIREPPPTPHPYTRSPAWWERLRNPPQAHSYHDGDGWEHVVDHIPLGTERCWFIPDVGFRPPVYDVGIEYISRVLGECCGFEYYLVGLDYRWLIAENDHDELIVSVIPAETQT